MAWERPNAFRKVLSIIGSFTNIRGGHAYPELVLKAERKPIRVFLQDGRNDNRALRADGTYDQTRDWFYQNVRLMEALSKKGYEVNYAWGMSRHGTTMGGAILAGDDALALARSPGVDRPPRHDRTLDAITGGPGARGEESPLGARGRSSALMQAPQTQKPPLPGVLFDASLDGDIDQVLALAMLFGFEGRRQVRVPSVSTSRFNLRTARFLDLVARFYGGDRPGAVINRNPAADRHVAGGQAELTAVPPMLDAALLKTGADGKPAYLRHAART